MHHEALVRQPAEQVRDARPVTADRCRGVDVEGSDEHSEPAKQRLLLLAEQIIAPGQHRAQGPVPLVAAPRAGQQPQRVLKGGEQSRGAQRRAPGSGQLDRQWQSVQPRAQLRDHPGLRHELRVRGQRPVAEQPLGVRAQRQRGDRHTALTRDAQPLPAGHQHTGGRAGGQYPLGELGRLVDHVLAVVQHEQRPPGAQPRRDRLRERLVRALGHTQRGRDRPGHEPVAYRHQVHERTAGRQQRDCILGHHRGQPGLAHAARTQQRHQPGLLDRGQHGSALGAAADERRPGRGQASDAARFPRVGAGQLRQRPPVGHTVLAQQRRHVAFHGAHGDVQPVRDLRVGQPRAERGEHLGLPLRYPLRHRDPFPWRHPWWSAVSTDDRTCPPGGG